MAPPPGSSDSFTYNTVEETPSSETTTSESTPVENSEDALVEDEELTRAFVGEKYDNFYNGKFNIWAFLFGIFYIFYRKMFLYGICYFIVSFVFSAFILKNYLTYYGICIILAVLFNKVYLVHASNTVEKIKAKNPNLSREELKEICAKRGGTSVGQIFAGMIANFFISFILLIVLLLAGITSSLFGIFGNLGIGTKDNKTNNTNGTLVENVYVSGYGCVLSNCSLTVEYLNKSITYTLKTNNNDLLTKLKDYNDYVQLDIYYDSNSDTNTIIGYKITNKANNEDLTNVKDEGELRVKLGLYALGDYTEVMTLTEIGMSGYTFDDDNNSVNYVKLTFKDKNSREYEMEYIGSLPSIVIGGEYTIRFTVSEDTFGYKYTITSLV